MIVEHLHFIHTSSEIPTSDTMLTQVPSNIDYVICYDKNSNIATIYFHEDGAIEILDTGGESALHEHDVPYLFNQLRELHEDYCIDLEVTITTIGTASPPVYRIQIYDIVLPFSSITKVRYLETIDCSKYPDISVVKVYRNMTKAAFKHLLEKHKHENTFELLCYDAKASHWNKIIVRS